MPATRNFGLLMVARQAAEGTAVTDMTTALGFSMPIISGMIGPVKEYGDLPRQGSSMLRLGRYVQRATIQGTVRVMGHPEAIGLLLYNAMGSELAISGAGPYVHTFVMTDTWPGQLTVWASVGSGSDADVWQFRDAEITRLAFMGQSQQMMEVEVEFVAKHYTKTAAGAAGFPTNYAAVAVLEDETPRFKYEGSTLKFDTDSAVPTIMDNVESVTIEIRRDPEIRYGTKLTPALFAPDRLVNVSGNFVYNTGAPAGGGERQGWNFLEDAYLAALNGDPDQSVPSGSFDIQFNKHPSGATSILRVVSGGGAGLPSVVAIQQNWQFTTTRPEASGQPTLVEYSVDGIAARPAAGTTEITAILTNDRASLYST